MSQLSLFDAVTQVYRRDGEAVVQQEELYSQVAELMHLSKEQTSAESTLSDGSTFNVFKRDCRWVQQRLKAKGVLERVDRGMWSLTKAGKDELTEIQPGYVCLAFSTELGVCLWGDAQTVGQKVIDQPINLILSSPPYLGPNRNYGVFSDERKWVDFIVEALDPYVQKMAPGAGLVLNVGNDSFEKGRPARSIGIERLVIAIHDELGLSLVDRVVWKGNKCPGPTQWSFIRRYMLRSGFEFALCFTNDTDAMCFDNRRVLEDHSDQYLKWCREGGQKKEWQNSSYRKKAGAFSQTTVKRSKIPSNVLEMGVRHADMIQVKKYAQEHGLPEHTAMFPVAFAEFFIKWATRRGDLVLDLFGGTMSVAAAAEKLGRRWMSCDKVYEFIQMGASRFPGASLNENLLWPSPVSTNENP